MYNSIQYFVEKVIPQIEEKREKFMKKPTEFGSVVVELKEVLDESTGCQTVRPARGVQSDRWNSCQRELGAWYLKKTIR